MKNTIAYLFTILSFQLFSEVVVLESKDETSADIPMSFKVEKTNWDESMGWLYVWGTVTNTGNKAYSYVKVTITARDSKGGLVTRKSIYTAPRDIGPGQVGYVERSPLQCDGVKPVKIEVKVTGS